MPNTSSPTILLVDDEALFLESLKDALERRTGAQVVTAKDGIEALGQIETHRLDLIITDLRMPGLGGVELITALHAMRFEGRVIVVSAYITPEAEKAVRNLGAMACFEKPVDLDRLIGLAQDVLRHPAVSFQGLSISGFTRLLEAEKKTCVLEVRRERKLGELTFVDGRLTDAVTGDLTGKAAAIEILAWEEARLEMVGLETPPEQRITDDLRYLQEEALALRAQEKRVAHSDAPEVPLDEVAGITGFVAAAIVDSTSGKILRQVGVADDLDFAEAARGYAEGLRQEIQLIERLGLDDQLEDLVCTTGRHYHLFRPLRVAPALFLYALLSRQDTNLVLSRQQVAKVESQAAW